MSKRAKRKPAKVLAPSKSALAAGLGISKQLLNAHVKRLGASAPPLDDIAAWETVLAADGREGSGPPELRRKIGEARLRLLDAAADREQLRRDKEKGDVLDKAEVGTALQRGIAHFFLGLDREFCGALPSELVGRDAEEIGLLLSGAIEKFKATLRQDLAALMGRTVPAEPVNVVTPELLARRREAEARWHSETDPAKRERIWFDELDPLLRGELPANSNPQPTISTP